MKMEYLAVKQEPVDSGYELPASSSRNGQELSSLGLPEVGRKHLRQPLESQRSQDIEPKKKHPKLTTLLFGSTPKSTPANDNSQLRKILANQSNSTIHPTKETLVQSNGMLQNHIRRDLSLIKMEPDEGYFSRRNDSNFNGQLSNPERNSSMLSVLQSVPVDSGLVSMETSNNRIQTAMLADSTVAIDTRSNGIQHRSKNSETSELQKAHKKLSGLLTGSSHTSPSVFTSPSSSSLIPALSSSSPLPVSSTTPKSSTPETRKGGRLNSALLQQLLTMGPSGYIRQDTPEPEVKVDQLPDTENNELSRTTSKPSSSALLKLLAGRKQSLEDIYNRNYTDGRDSPSNYGADVYHQKSERRAGGKLDATINKLSNALCQNVIQMQNLPVQEMGAWEPRPDPQDAVGAKMINPSVTGEETLANGTYNVYGTALPNGRDTSRVDEQSHPPPNRVRDELVAHLPLPGKDFLNFYKCEECGKAFPHKGTLKVHQRSHSMEKHEFKCDICGKVCSAKGYLLIHMRTHRKEDNQSFITTEKEIPSEAPAHQIVSVPPDLISKKFSCTICGKTFTENENLFIHLRMHSGEKLYKCDVCGNGFTRKTQLGIHMRIHTGEKPYECEICGKTFRQSNGLNLHMITHNDIKPYNCKICGSGFGRKAHYEKHMRWHRGERPFQCGTCGKSFTDKFNLSMHLKIHSQKKDHICTICGKGYNQATHLKNHLQFHSGERGYKCEDCGTIFEHKRSLRNHIKASHFDTYEKSLTSKTSLRRFQKLRASGEIAESSVEKGQSSNDNSDEDDDSDNDTNSSDEQDESQVGNDEMNIKTEPEDWYSNDEGEDQNVVNADTGDTCYETQEFGDNTDIEDSEENQRELFVKEEVHNPYPGEEQIHSNIEKNHFDTCEKSLTPKTSVRRFRKLQASCEKGHDSNDNSDEDDTDNDMNSSDEQDGSQVGNDEMNIKTEPEDWCSNDEIEEQNGVNDETGDTCHEMQEFGDNTDIEHCEENEEEPVIKEETDDLYPDEDRDVDTRNLGVTAPGLLNASNIKFGCRQEYQVATECDTSDDDDQSDTGTFYIEKTSDSITGRNNLDLSIKVKTEIDNNTITAEDCSHHPSQDNTDGNIAPVETMLRGDNYSHH